MDTMLRGIIPHRDNIIRVDQGLHPNSVEMNSNTFSNKTPVTRVEAERVL